MSEHRRSSERRRRQQEEERLREEERRRRMARARRRRQVIRRRRMMALGALLIVVILIAAAVVTIHRKSQERKQQEAIEKQQQEEEAENNTLHIRAVGDNLIHDAFIEAGSDNDWDFDFLYENIKEDVSDADLASVNQETPLTTDHKDAAGYPDFNTPSEVGYGGSLFRRKCAGRSGESQTGS